MDFLFCCFTLLMAMTSFLYFNYRTSHHRKTTKLPGPPALPIIGHLHLLKKPLHRSLTDLSARYGPILFLRFGSRPALIISSPSLAEECLSKNDVVFANRPRLLAGKHLGYDYTVILWAPHGPHWSNLRRLVVSNILSNKCMQMSSHVRSEEVRSLARKLFIRSSGGGGSRVVVELKSVFSELTYNTMMRMIAGKRYYGENVTNEGAAKSFRTLIMEAAELFGRGNLGDFFPAMRSLDMLVERAYKRVNARRDAFWQSLIDEHRRRPRYHHSDPCTNKPVEEQETMIDVLLALREEDPECYTDEVIKGVIAVLLMAGTETSATTMEWAMSLLLNHPEVLEKAQMESRSIIGQGRMLEEVDLPNLPYLNNIIKETLRLYPVLPFLLPHESSEECTVGGFNVAPGTMLLLNLWTMQRDPNIWEDPLAFKPERFDSANEDGYKFIPFGMGRRRCPGEALGFKMMGLTIGSLIHCFEWARVGKEQLDMKEGMGLIIPKVVPLEALYKPCETMAKTLCML